MSDYLNPQQQSQLIHCFDLFYQAKRASGAEPWERFPTPVVRCSSDDCAEMATGSPEALRPAGWSFEGPTSSFKSYCPGCTIYRESLYLDDAASL